ncbi:MAG: bifunctional adenosylcobinamide kinase/adenosylcobinamide-phosphate guanylyltransferase [Lachnospiraceae bacterium]|nr:bifunctional adenosylcobinamide kinase/adenosylcobinamide-phosphate guanylyltransferase [Lachnospiraceae bacterium]
MKLIIGGAFQGKLEFARKTYGTEDGWIDGRNCELSEIMTCRGVHHFHEYIRRLLNTDDQPQQTMPQMSSRAASFFTGASENLSTLEQQAKAFTDWLYRSNPELLVVSTELGYGVVPMESDDRLWREAVGRVCTCLASDSDEVVRVVCGIGMWLKKPDPGEKE